MSTFSDIKISIILYIANKEIDGFSSFMIFVIDVNHYGSYGTSLFYLNLYPFINDLLIDSNSTLNYSSPSRITSANF